MGMAEHDPLRLHTHQPLDVGVVRLGVEAVHVGERRRVAVQRAPVRARLGERRQLAAQLLTDHLTGALDERKHRLGRVRRVFEPTVDVAPDPLGIELTQAGNRLLRPGAEGRIVAAEQESLRGTILEHRFESGQIAVHVVQQRQHGRHASGAFAHGYTRPPLPGP